MSGWSQYHDWLMQEAVALMTEPEWFNQPSITSRLAEIRNELSSAGSRGNIPALDAEGNVVRDEDGNIVYQTQEEGFSELLGQFQRASNEGRAANEQRYQQLVGDPNTLMNYQQRTDHLRDQWIDPVTQGYTNLRGSADTLRGSLYDQYTAAKNQADTLGTASNQDWSNLRSGLQQQHGDMVAGYDQRLTDLQGMLAGYGSQQASDITQRFDQQRSKEGQSLASRGLGNTTVRSSVNAGLGAQESQEQRRLAESIQKLSLEYATPLWQQQLAARERGIDADRQLGANSIADANQFRTAGYQTLMQQAGVDQQLGSQSLGIGQQGLGWQGTAAGLMSDVTREPLGVVERRTDTSPALADIANLSMQFGRGSSSMFAMPGFGTQTYYTQPQGSNNNN